MNALLCRFSLAVRLGVAFAAVLVPLGSVLAGELQQLVARFRY